MFASKSSRSKSAGKLSKKSYFKFPFVSSLASASRNSDTSGADNAVAALPANTNPNQNPNLSLSTTMATLTADELEELAEFEPQTDANRVVVGARTALKSARMQQDHQESNDDTHMRNIFGYNNHNHNQSYYSGINNNNNNFKRSHDQRRTPMVPMMIDDELDGGAELIDDNIDRIAGDVGDDVDANDIDAAADVDDDDGGGGDDDDDRNQLDGAYEHREQLAKLAGAPMSARQFHSTYQRRLAHGRHQQPIGDQLRRHRELHHYHPGGDCVVDAGEQAPAFTQLYHQQHHHHHNHPGQLGQRPYEHQQLHHQHKHNSGRLQGLRYEQQQQLQAIRRRQLEDLRHFQHLQQQTLDDRLAGDSLARQQPATQRYSSGQQQRQLPVYQQPQFVHNLRLSQHQANQQQNLHRHKQLQLQQQQQQQQLSFVYHQPAVQYSSVGASNPVALAESRSTQQLLSNESSASNTSSGHQPAARTQTRDRRMQHSARQSAAPAKEANAHQKRSRTRHSRKSTSSNGHLVGEDQPQSLGCCAKMAKLLLLLTNFLFWSAGLALGSWGILQLVDDHKYNLSHLLVFEPNSRMSLFQLLSWSFITLGGAAVLVGICGCSAIFKNNRWILGLYIFLILAIFALDLATGLLAIIFQERLVATVRLRLANKLRSDYGVSASFTAAIDYIQTRYECCGLEGHLDYDQSVWRLQRLGGFEATVARTCCHLRNTYDDQAHINPRPVNESMCQSSDVRFHQSYRYRRGCLDDLERLVRNKIWTYTMACAAVGAIILFSLLFATCFCRSIPKTRKGSRDLQQGATGAQNHHQQQQQPQAHQYHHR